MPCLRAAISVAFLATLASPPPLRCQQQQIIELGVHPPEQNHARKDPSNFALAARSVGSSVMGSVVGGVAGLAVDQAYCERHHGKDPGFLFGPCFLYANEGFGAGWFGGAIIGSAHGAIKAARKRGCPRDAALLRAIVGATLGAVPGVIVVAGRTGNYPPSRSLLIAGAPLLSGLGAAAMVGGCHSVGNSPSR